MKPTDQAFAGVLCVAFAATLLPVALGCRVERSEPVAHSEPPQGPNAVYAIVSPVPIFVAMPSSTMTGTMSDYAWWGWRPFIPGQHHVTGSDGNMGTPVIVGSDG